MVIPAGHVAYFLLPEVASMRVKFVIGLMHGDGLYVKEKDVLEGIHWIWVVFQVMDGYTTLTGIFVKAT